MAEARNRLEAVSLVEQHQPEVVFLDIRMPGLNGVEAARDILQLDYGDDGCAPEIVFITAYDQYAVQAFEQGAVDYVLKPAQMDRLQRTKGRLLERLASRNRHFGPGDTHETDLQPPSGARPLSTPGPSSPEDEATRMPADHANPVGLQQLLVRLSAQISGQASARLEVIQAGVGTSIQMIPVADVLFFISDEKYTRVQTAHTEALIRKPIKELLAELDPQRFWQIHRSTIVNVQAVQSVVRDERGRQIVSMKGHPQKLEVSRSFAGVFKGM